MRVGKVLPRWTHPQRERSAAGRIAFTHSMPHSQPSAACAAADPAPTRRSAGREAQATVPAPPACPTSARAPCPARRGAAHGAARHANPRTQSPHPAATRPRQPPQRHATRACPPTGGACCSALNCHVGCLSRAPPRPPPHPPTRAHPPPHLTHSLAATCEGGGGCACGGRAGQALLRCGS